MKLLLFTSCIILFGFSATVPNSVDDPLQRIQQEIIQLKIKDEVLEKDYNEKIKSLMKNYEEKIADLEEILRRNLPTQSGKCIVLFSISVHSQQVFQKLLTIQG